MAEERISKLEEMSIKTSKTEIQREKEKKKKDKTFKNCGTVTKVMTYT